MKTLNARIILISLICISFCRIPAGFGMEKLLRFLPNDPATSKFVIINDFEMASKALSSYGTERQKNRLTGQTETYLDLFFNDLAMADTGYISGANYKKKSWLPQFKENDGYAPQDLAKALYSGTDPKSYVTVLEFQASHGFSPPTWAKFDVPLPFSKENYRGVPLLFWGDDGTMDLRNRFQLPIIDDLGRGGKFAFYENYLLYSVYRDSTRSMVQCVLQERTTLSQNGLIANLVKEAEKYPIYSMILSTDPSRFDGSRIQTSGSELIEKLVPLKPYSAYLSAVGWDKTGRFLLLGLAHDKTHKARSNFPLLKKKINSGKSLKAGFAWSSMFSGHAIHFGNNKKYLFAKLYFHPQKPLRIWKAHVQAVDSLLLFVESD